MVPTPSALPDPADVFGMSPVRIGILRIVAHSREPVAASELMAELGVVRATLSLHLKALVDAGVLRQQLDRSPSAARSGFNRLVWSVVPDRVESLIAELSRQIQR